MTLEQLLGLSADDWDKISDQDLMKMLSPYLVVTRPKERVVQPHNEKQKSLKQQAEKAYILAMSLMGKEVK